MLWRDLDGVVIVLDSSNGQYFRLEGSAARIWQLIDDGDSLESIVELLSQLHNDQVEAVERDIRTFVEAAVAGGLLELGPASASGSDSATTTAPPLQIERSRLAVNGSVDALRREFAASNHIHLPQLIEPGLLNIIYEKVQTGRFVDRTHQGIGTEECLTPGTATSILQLVFNDPALLRVMADIGGCEAVKCFDGRVYRMASGAGHYDSWHSDAGENRLLAVSVNLSVAPYEGGLLEIRRASSTHASHVIANAGFGNATMFRISPELRHRVSGVTGSEPRTAYAGWFRSSPDFHDLFFASLPT